MSFDTYETRQNLLIAANRLTGSELYSSTARGVSNAEMDAELEYSEELLYDAAAAYVKAVDERKAAKGR